MCRCRISFGISLFEPGLNECTLTFENSSHFYEHKFFLSRKAFYFSMVLWKSENSGYNLSENDDRLSEANSRLKTWHKN